MSLSGRIQRSLKQDNTEDVEIRKRGSSTMNHDEGQYFLPHILDELLELGRVSRGGESAVNSEPIRPKYR